MEISCTKEESKLFEKIGAIASGMRVSCFLIGGVVRDKLLGRPTKDIDIVCTGDGIALAQAVAQAISPKLKVNYFKTFGTAQFRLNELDIEFVGARKESYSSDSRKPQVTEGTIEDDQKRRDLTINALAISLNKENYGKLIDPFNGIEDLKNKIIRTPLEPGITFSDDPLRMMRAIRFATQLDFSITEPVFEAIHDHKERIKIISQERITDELNKIVLTPKPSVGFAGLP